MPVASQGSTEQREANTAFAGLRLPITTLGKLIAKLHPVEVSYGGDLHIVLQGTRWSDGSNDLEELKTLLVRGHQHPTRGFVGDLKETPDSVRVRVALNRHAGD